VAILSTTLPDGSPHATPVWIDVEPDGAHILINTVVGHVKLKNIDRDPRVAVTVVDSANHFRTCQVRGTVVEKTEDGAIDHINMLSKKYTGRFPYTLAEGEKRMILRIKPTHVFGAAGGWRGRQGDTGPAWQDPQPAKG
jgi:PPOX class probable F420-dependent enzyme